ncbi:MAG: NAD(P)H-binding protein [Bacteriovorax sp.]|nr:NAD(P)H-binding protein [Bacteriovorax sp.]
MNVLILGATGKTGVHVVKEVLAMGHEVYALSRHPERLSISDSRLHLIKGDTEKPDDVNQAVSLVDEVISVINNPRISDNPWAKVIGQPFMIRDSIRNVVSAMEAHGKKRIIVMSTFGAGESFHDLSWWLRIMINKSNLKVAFDDHTGQEEVLKESSLDWTVVRCVQLSDTNEMTNLIISLDNYPKAATKISRKHVAKFLVQQLVSTDYIRKLPTISSRG